MTDPRGLDRASGSTTDPAAIDLDTADPSWFPRVLRTLARDYPEISGKVWATTITENAKEYVAKYQVAEHFTAWLTTDPTALQSDFIDVTVLRDEATTFSVGDDGVERPSWSSTDDERFQARTGVRVDDGQDSRATAEAEQLLHEAGWRRAEPWAEVPTGYTATVERSYTADPHIG